MHLKASRLECKTHTHTHKLRRKVHSASVTFIWAQTDACIVTLSVSGGKHKQWIHFQFHQLWGKLVQIVILFVVFFCASMHQTDKRLSLNKNELDERNNVQIKIETHSERNQRRIRMFWVLHEFKCMHHCLLSHY